MTTEQAGIRLTLDEAGMHQLASNVAAQVVEQFKTLGWAPQNGVPEHVREPMGSDRIPPTAQKATPNGTRTR
jgi:hypothetical protein